MDFLFSSRCFLTLARVLFLWSITHLMPSYLSQFTMRQPQSRCSSKRMSRRPCSAESLLAGSGASSTSIARLITSGGTFVLLAIDWRVMSTMPSSANLSRSSNMWRVCQSSAMDESKICTNILAYSCWLTSTSLTVAGRCGKLLYSSDLVEDRLQRSFFLLPS